MSMPKKSWRCNASRLAYLTHPGDSWWYGLTILPLESKQTAKLIEVYWVHLDVINRIYTILYIWKDRQKLKETDKDTGRRRGKQKHRVGDKNKQADKEMQTYRDRRIHRHAEKHTYIKTSRDSGSYQLSENDFQRLPISGRFHVLYINWVFVDNAWCWCR